MTDTAAFLAGPLSKHFREMGLLNVTGDTALRQRLVAETKHLIVPLLSNTEFHSGMLNLVAIQSVPLHTIFARRDRCSVPYLLSDLVMDLKAANVSRVTIDEPTEHTIRSLADRMPSWSATPLPVLVEDSTGQRYLILEGNKRLAAAAISTKGLPISIQVVIGRSAASWPSILSHYRMNAGGAA